MFSLLARKPWYLLVLPVAVLAVALGYRGGQGMDDSNAELASALAGSGKAAVDAAVAPGRRADRAAADAVGPGLPVDLRAAIDDGRSLFTYSRQLRAAADAGNAEAGWIVSRIYDYCALYAMDPQGYALDSALLADMGLAEVPGMDGARERVGGSCTGFTAADGLGRGLLLKQRRSAAAAGNLAAEASLLAMGEPLRTDPEYRRGLVERVLNSQDPEAFLAVSPAMGVTAAGDDAYRGMVAGDQFAQLAWQVAACKLGLACGATSMLMTNYCANGGICSSVPGQDFETFVYDAAVPRQSVDKMNKLVHSLHIGQGGKS